jgi:hypothetical protein
VICSILIHSATTNNFISLCIFLLVQDVAAYIKKEFDKKYNPTWYVHVAVAVVVRIGIQQASSFCRQSIFSFAWLSISNYY